MQKILDTGVRRYGIHGASVAVIQEDSIVWVGVSGVSHDTLKMKPDMVFGIGSASKTVMATLTLKLVEQGTIGLDDPISKWLPSMVNVNGSITIRQLLGHTSGLFNVWDNERIWDDILADRTRYWTPQEVLSYLEEPYFPPGEGFHYSNINYLIIAMIIEKATESKLADLLHLYIWEPLNLYDVYLSQQEELPENLAHIYGDDFLFGDKGEDVTDIPRVSHESVIFGSGGVFTSAKSLAHFTQELFEGRILQSEMMAEMMRYVEFAPFSYMNAYGLGVQRYTPDFTRGEEAWGHGGASIGSTTYLIHLVDYHTTIIVMINAYPNSGADYIAKGLIRIILHTMD